MLPASCRNPTQPQHWRRESSSFHRNPSQKGSFELSPLPIKAAQAAHPLLCAVGVLSVPQERAGRLELMEGPLLWRREVT